MGNILRFFLPPPQEPVAGDTEPEKNVFILQAFRAAKHSDVNALQDLLSQNDHMDSTTPLAQVTDPTTGCTLLHTAMERGSPECVRFLVSQGCNLTKGDQSRETPLHAACMRDRVENLMAVLETEENLDLEVKDMWNRTLLLKAMVYNSEQVVQCLLSHGSNVDAQDMFKLTALHVAVSRNRLDLVRELVARGANLNLLNDRGRSPLSLAVTANNPTMVRELLMLGASTSHHSSFTLPTVTAIWEFFHRLEGGMLCQQSEEILHLMLAAHGHPLHSDPPNVVQNVLLTHDIQRYLPLIYKLLVCSDSTSDALQTLLPPLLMPSLPRSSLQRSRMVLRLFDLARRSARLALMANNRNVVWGVERLGLNFPSAVKGWLLLKDCDFKEFPVRN